ncbi:MAG: helix-turn-helix transcriptional regulator [Clostridia bacterium]|nr:helix-turn-helix transcriptional regulator [Clostridia bacterium]
MQNRMRELREAHELTQKEIAAALGITQRKYSYVETGTQPLTDELLVKLARYYHVTTDYILMLTD